MDSYVTGVSLRASKGPVDDLEDVSSVHSALTGSGFEPIQDLEKEVVSSKSKAQADDMQDEDWEDLADPQKQAPAEGEDEPVDMEVHTTGRGKASEWVHLKDLDSVNEDDKSAVAALVQEHTNLKGVLDATQQTADVLRQQLHVEARKAQQLNAELEASKASKHELESKVAALLAEKAALEASAKTADTSKAAPEGLALAKVEGLPKFVCKTCSADLAGGKAVLWSDCRMGKSNESGMLFNASVNADRHGPVNTMHLATGDYEVVDVRCRGCNTALGWRYLRAFSDKNKFKEGTTIMYKRLLTHVSK
jgi:hypothetical protein